MHIKHLFIKLLKNRQKNFNKDKVNDNIKSAKSILIKPLGSGSIGDAIIHTAHLYQLKSIYPNSKIGVIAKKSAKIIFKKSNLCDEIIDENLFNIFKNRNHWDIFLDFSDNFTSKSILQTHILNSKTVIIFYKYHKKAIT